jgi:hypothetical protein
VRDRHLKFHEDWDNLADVIDLDLVRNRIATDRV